MEELVVLVILLTLEIQTTVMDGGGGVALRNSHANGGNGGSLNKDHNIAGLRCGNGGGKCIRWCGC